MKRRNVSISSGIVGVILLAFFFLPLPISQIRQTGLVQIDPANTQRVTIIDDAIMTALHVTNGQKVTEGQLLAEFRSPRLESELATAQGSYNALAAEVDATTSMMREAKTVEERTLLESEKQQATSQMLQARAKVDNIQNQLDRLRERRGLRAPRSGVILGAPKSEEVGREMQRDIAHPFCTVGDPSKLIVVVPVSPAEYHLLQSDLDSDKSLRAAVRIPGRKSEVIRGMIVRLPESDAKNVPIALTHQAEGPLAIKPSGDPNIHQPQSQQYLVTVELPDTDPTLCPGSLVKVKVYCKWRTTAWWVWRKISSAFDLGLI